MSMLLAINETTNYYLFRRPVKMSLSFDRLAVLLRTELNVELMSGDIYIFINRRRTLLKIFVYEQKGYSIFYRRLDEGSFQLPMIAGDNLSYQMTPEQILFMLCGMTIKDGAYVRAERYEPLHGTAV